MSEIIFAEQLKELKQFAKELGFKIRKENIPADEVSWQTIENIPLPLGQIAHYEYGVALAFGLGKPTTYILNTKTDKLDFGELIECYTHEYVIKTAEVKDRRFVIEKVSEEEVAFDNYKGLLLAFKFKDLGTIDGSFIQPVYKAILESLPNEIANELINNKFSELEEKLVEVQELNPPESEKIIKSIVGEFIGYANAVRSVAIKPDVKFPNLVEKACMYYIVEPEYGVAQIDISILISHLDGFLDFVDWCQLNDYDIKDTVRELILGRLSGLEEELIEAKKSAQKEVMGIVAKFMAYAETAQKTSIKPNKKLPNLAESACIYYIFDSFYRKEGDQFKRTVDFVNWYEQTGDNIKVQSLNKNAEKILQKKYIDALSNHRIDYINIIRRITGIEPEFKPFKPEGLREAYKESKLSKEKEK